MSILKRPNDRLLIHHPTSCRIHQHTSPLHRPYLALPDQPARILAQRHMRAQHIRFLAERLDTLHIDTPRRDVGPTLPIVIQHAHRKGVYEVGEVQPYPAESQDPEGACGEVVRRPGRDGGFPRPNSERAFSSGKVAEGGEDEVEGGRGGAFVDGNGGVGDADAWRGRRWDGMKTLRLEKIAHHFPCMPARR